MEEQSSALQEYGTLKTLSILWEGNTSASRQSMILVLPDSLRSRYYIRDPRDFKYSKLKKNEREKVRIEYLCHRDSANSGKLNRAVRYETVAIVPSKEERAVDRALLEPYRRNSETFDRLLQRIEMKKRQKMAVKSPSITIVKKSVAVNEVVASEQEKEPNVSHTDLPSTIEVESDAEEEEDSVLVPAPPLAPAASAASFARPNVLKRSGSIVASLLPQERLKAHGFCWVTMVLAIRWQMQLAEKLVASRNTKEQNIKMWKAAVVIQRRWRKSEYANTFSAAVKKFLYQQGRSTGRHLTQLREQAADLITAFLSDASSGFKSTVKNYIKAVKKCQAIIRRRKLVTQYRVSLLELVLDRCIHMIYTLSSTLRATAADETLLSKNLLLPSDPSVICEMATPAFYNKIKNMPAKFHHIVKKFYKHGKWNIGTSIKHSVLHKLLRQKRMMHKFQIRHLMAQKMELPQLTEKDARAFVKGTSDPLGEHVAHLMESLQTIEDLRRNRQTGTDFVSNTVNANRMFPPLLLLSSLSVNDMLSAVIEIMYKYEQLRKQRKKQRRYQNELWPEGTAGARKASTMQKKMCVVATASPGHSPRQRGTLVMFSGDQRSMNEPGNKGAKRGSMLSPRCDEDSDDSSDEDEYRKSGMGALYAAFRRTDLSTRGSDRPTPPTGAGKSSAIMSPSIRHRVHK